MNIKHLQYSVEICRCGSINKAAQNLYLSQSNLSTLIKGLENELGYQIFQRKNSGIELTPEGKLFMASAKIILNEAKKIYDVPQTLMELQNLAVSCTYSSLFMKAFIQFKRCHPAGQVADKLRETGLRLAISDVIEGDYRLAVCHCFTSRKEKYVRLAQKYNLHIEVLQKKVPIHVVMARNHPLARRAQLSCEDVQHCNVVLYAGFDNEDWLDLLHLPDDRKVLYIADRGGFNDVVRHGEHIALTIQEGLPESANLISVPLVEPPDTVEILLLHQKLYHLNQREQLFVQFLKRYISDYYGSDERA